MEDNLICSLQARISAKALQNARSGMALETQLTTWDEYISSNKEKRQSKDELIALRALIKSTWIMSETYPDLKADELGDYVYDACANEKETHPSVKF